MDNIAGIIASMGQLPFFLQALFGFMIFVSFILILFFGFGKKWKGLLSLVRDIKDSKEEGYNAIDDIGIAMSLKSKTDDIDKETQLRIIRRSRNVIYSLMGEYVTDCPLIVYNLRNEFEIIFKDYIKENHLVKKSFKTNYDYETDRLYQSIKDVCEKSQLLTSSTPCDIKKEIKWEEIEDEIKKAIEKIYDIMTIEVKGACHEKLFEYSSVEMEIKNQRVKKYVIDTPKEKNEEYLKKIE